MRWRPSMAKLLHPSESNPYTAGREARAAARAKAHEALGKRPLSPADVERILYPNATRRRFPDA